MRGVRCCTRIAIRVEIAVPNFTWIATDSAADTQANRKPRNADTVAWPGRQPDERGVADSPNWLRPGLGQRVPKVVAMGILMIQ